MDTIKQSITKTQLGLVGYTEASKMLGVAVNTLRHWVCSKKIGHYKIGKRVWFKPAELQTFVDTRKVEAI